MTKKFISRFLLFTLCAAMVPTTSKASWGDNVFVGLICGTIFTGLATMGPKLVKQHAAIKQEITDANAKITAEKNRINSELATANQQIQAQLQLLASKQRELAQREQTVQKREFLSSTPRSAAKASDILNMLASVATAQNPYDTNQASQALKRGVELAYKEAFEQNNVTEMVLLQEITDTINSDEAALQELLTDYQRRAYQQ